MTKHTSATGALSKVQASEIKVRRSFCKVSYFCGSYKGQRCLSHDWPAKGGNGKCAVPAPWAVQCCTLVIREALFSKSTRLKSPASEPAPPPLLYSNTTCFELCASARVTHYMAFGVEGIFTKIHISKIINNLWSGAISEPAWQIHSLYSPRWKRDAADCNCTVAISLVFHLLGEILES